MMVQSESLPSREKGKEIGCCYGVYVPTRELQKVLLGADGKVSMVTNSVEKGGREIPDACCDSWNISLTCGILWLSRVFATEEVFSFGGEGREVDEKAGAEGSEHVWDAWAGSGGKSLC
ncbi:hypothetical protein NPIL_586551 [Nephila pilipes]|uniref:Uncharacterized protein n=1 Tax=Nephila pilipes TaxID=299642 RepID=A0A8X6M7K3_NEPPI|nr:hypothetical protein NPIL_586551 [Nephila pilipes]